MEEMSQSLQSKLRSYGFPELTVDVKHLYLMSYNNTHNGDFLEVVERLEEFYGERKDVIRKKEKILERLRILEEIYKAKVSVGVILSPRKMGLLQSKSYVIADDKRDLEQLTFKEKIEIIKILKKGKDDEVIESYKVRGVFERELVEEEMQFVISSFESILKTNIEVTLNALIRETLEKEITDMQQKFKKRGTKEG